MDQPELVMNNTGATSESRNTSSAYFGARGLKGPRDTLLGTTPSDPFL